MYGFLTMRLIVPTRGRTTGGGRTWTPDEVVVVIRPQFFFWYNTKCKPRVAGGETSLSFVEEREGEVPR